ncbi:MAG TPA: outer membrane protein assembly factor BamD, partial [Candidatus Saccharimonadales bacterium]|nr:outer membrane protein assembly factor BamD [Candidatus Saccharimonadales bacterium]
RAPGPPIPSGKDESLSTEQLLQKGKALLERHSYFRARTSLEKVLSRPDATRDTIADVNLLIADAYFEDGGIINLADALSRYTSFLNFYPTHPKADYAQYQLGLCYLKQALGPDKDQDTTRKALDAFAEVEKQHPASEWVERAHEQMRICRERLAEAEMRVGLFYVKRSAWEGAIDRFRDLIGKYPMYSRLDRTYFELARALDEVKKSDEAVIYYQKILESFPRSRYAQDARDAIHDETASPEKTAEADKDKRSSESRVAVPPKPAQGGS